MKYILKFTGMLFVYQFVTTFLAAMTVPAAEIFKNTFVIILSVIVPTIVIYSMSYLSAWKAGFGDKGYNRGIGKTIKLNGLFSSLIFVFPNLLLLVLYIFFKSPIPTLLFTFYNLNLNGVYTLFPNKYPIVLLIAIIIPVILATLGYNLGYRDILVKDKLIYKK